MKAKDMILADAIEQCILAEKKILKLKRAIIVLIAIIGILGGAILWTVAF